VNLRFETFCQPQSPLCQTVASVNACLSDVMLISGRGRALARSNPSNWMPDRRATRALSLTPADARRIRPVHSAGY